jgi:metal-responsive CopG/Arc/MetJ family transcriptional regulator
VKRIKIISASVDQTVLDALDKFAAKSAYSRSTLITIAVAQLVGVPYEPPRKGEEGEKNG